MEVKQKVDGAEAVTTMLSHVHLSAEASASSTIVALPRGDLVRLRPHYHQVRIEMDWGTAGNAELQQGGNAVDAAVAVALCLGVASPASSGIGGGAFILIRQPNGSAEVIDAREIAPAAATEDMFAGAAACSLSL